MRETRLSSTINKRVVTRELLMDKRGPALASNRGAGGGADPVVAANVRF
jgi:hypothetical protein